jgi:hypothetical protein
LIEFSARYEGQSLFVPAMRAAPYAAISGQPGWQVARYQAGSNNGPIVEGSYSAKVEVDPAGAQFKRALDPDGLYCKFVPSAKLQEIQVQRQKLDRLPGQSRLVIQDCSPTAAAWGRYRWRLQPDAKTAKTAKTIADYGRTGGFHIHGGGTTALGTSGCIRVGDEFWSDLRAFIEKHAKTLKTLRLRVQYGSRDTRTGGTGDLG